MSQIDEGDDLNFDFVERFIISGASLVLDGYVS